MLDNRQTQFRRVMKPQPRHIGQGARMIAAGISSILSWPGNRGPVNIPRDCSFGGPGDLLLVKEALRQREDGRLVYDVDKCLLDIQIIPDDFVPSRRYLPTNLMPRWAARLWLRVVSVRVERVQEISEEDANAEGLSLEACEGVFEDCARKHESREYCWLEDADGTQSELTLCPDCAQAACAERPGSSVSIDYCPESDGPAYCDQCEHALFMSLTEYGIDRELFLERGCGVETPRFATTYPRDARIMAMIAGCGHLTEPQKRRISTIGFATVWDSHNDKRGHPWSNNDWVWAVTFERISEVENNTPAGEGGRE